MEVFGYGVGAHKARIATGAIAGALLIAGATTASAQTSGGNSADKAPSEAALRAAASPFRFILQNAKTPARKPAAAPKPVEAPAVAEPRHPVAPPVQQASLQPSAPAAAAAAPAPAAAAAAPVEAAPPASEPAVASLSRKPIEPPPPKHDIIPIRTDEPHLSPALLREQPHGVVKVEFDIQPDGSVGDVKVLSSTNRVLNRPTVDAVQAWKFQPVDDVLTVQTEVDYKLDQ